MDEFVDATIDVWDIPTESATRVGHPAPFPVELPRRLIELYTYRGDLVLDPFMGSGSTAVAAVRTERHYVGFDTDEDYVALAERRIADERAAIGRSASTATAPAGDRPPGPAARRDRRDGRHCRGAGGRCPGRKAQRARPPGPGSRGFADIERDVAFGDLGLTVDFRARDATGGVWLFELSGRLLGHPARPAAAGRAVAGAGQGQRPARGPRHATPRRDDLGPLVLLSTDAPAPRSAGGKALRAVQGDDRSGPVHDVLELLDPASAWSGCAATPRA